MLDRGLDLLDLDSITDAEVEAFQASYRELKGLSLPGYDFWLRRRPDVLKRHRLQAKVTSDEEGARFSLPHVLAFLHLYAADGYMVGIRYELHQARQLGATREQVLEVLALSMIHGGPISANGVAESDGMLVDWPDRKPDGRLFPDGWMPDPAALHSGLDFTTVDLSADELAQLRTWYMSVLGEVPDYLAYLSRVRPRLLKAMRGRFETALRGALPKQMVPYILIHFNVSRSRGDGIREAVLLARGFGMTSGQIDDAVCWGALYGGPSSINIALSHARALLAQR